jgi:hypothetical protein
VIGSLLDGMHKHERVMIASIFNSTPEPKAVLILKNGDMICVTLSEVSAAWHFDEATGQFVEDFPPEA